ncbi:DNA repair protein RecN [Angustibacter sp. Root456]|uniref:DNA repair protein RecN n=1 Tax=Angustibacter sp. Root456 TaxID=1736539 RepID=UPI0006FB1701|nr:DNA repair protein RecN [Angustibacter sp. Root456]
MRIRSLGVISDAVLELDPGLTVVTGETGAGKTMVVTGLGLLLGARADAGAVRTGATQALVEGRVVIDPAGSVARAAEDAGAELDDDVLLLARTVTSAGRSRAHAGGRSVPVGVLGELASELVTVHGQSDQLRLLQPARQREALDRFAGHDALLAEHAAAYQQLRDVERELLDVTTHARERAEEAERLRLALHEVEALDPQPGEDHALRDEDSRLAHADALRTAAQQAHAALQGDTLDSLDTGGTGIGADATSLVAEARHRVESARDLDPALADLERRLSEIGYLLADVAGDLASYAAGIEADPARLTAVQERRAALTALVRRIEAVGGVEAEVADVDGVLAWAAWAASRLLQLDDGEGTVGRLRAERDRLRGDLGRLSAAVHASRADAGRRLAELVTAELAQLAMPQARVEVTLTQREDPEGIEVELPTESSEQRAATLVVHEHGVDEVELLLAPHSGAPLRPVARGASGGELSRVMLALEVVLAGADPVPTFVFDEVDAGVGGRAAIEIGRRLARLARSAQVIVVTHLPQVAAYADRHLVVVKSDDGAVTESGVRTLDDAERVAELARMLAGQEESQTARAHAQELREAALSDLAVVSRPRPS